MKSEIKKIDGTTREITVEITGDVVKNKFETVFKKIGETAKIKGFRAGHVPRDILEKNFAHEANEMVLQDLIPECCTKAAESQGLDVLNLTGVTDVKLERGSLSFKAQVEIRPEITVNDYKGLKISYKKTEVSSDEIKRHLDSLKESRKIDVLDDAFARSVGYPTLAEFEKVIERQLSAQKDSQNRQDAENQIVEHLTKGMEFTVPPSLIKRQLQELVRQTEMNLALKGVSKERIMEHEQKLFEELEPQAKEQVKLYLIFSEIAKKESIPLDDHMAHSVMEFLLKEAKWTEAA